MFHLQTSGTPRELGKAHGRRLKAKICQLLDHYRHGFRDGTGGWRKGLDPESRRAFSLKRSEMIARIYPEEYFEDLKSRSVTGKAGTPEDIAEAVLYLCAPGSSWLTGEVLDINGGAHLKAYPDVMGHLTRLMEQA